MKIENFPVNKHEEEIPVAKKSKFRKFVEKTAVIGTAAVALGGAVEMQPQSAEAQNKKEYVAVHNPRAIERINALKTLKVYQQAGYEITKEFIDRDGSKHYELKKSTGDTKMVTVPPAPTEVAGPREINKPYNEKNNLAENTSGPTEVKEFQWKK